jgi:saccharopine dehydrogenase-like NADP-dependent oxidoreductase
MKVFCLGGAGKISREAVYDLVQFSKFETITIGDFSESAGKEVVAWLNDPRVDFVKVDVRNQPKTVTAMQGYDVVMDGTTISLNGLSTACIAEAGCHGINLNGFGAEDAFDETFRKKKKTCVAGFGMTPGVTNMMVMHVAEQLDTIDTVRISHGAFRPIAFSPAIAETTRIEYDPDLPDRCVYEEGQMVKVPPFARPREIQLPEPYGKTVQYIIPHSETRTLSKALQSKGVKLIEVRGTWPTPNMELLRALYDWGFLRNDPIRVGDQEVGILDCIAEYLMISKEGQCTELYGYSLHVEVTGTKNGATYRHIITHTHPPSDGSVKGWERLRAYTRNVGIPLAIGTEILAKGQVSGFGVLTPEESFSVDQIFNELKKRDLLIHESVECISGD